MQGVADESGEELTSKPWLDFVHPDDRDHVRTTIMNALKDGRPFRMDDWLLHVIESPSASGGRGLVRGQFFDRAGRLVASTAQEGLMREHSGWTKPAGQQV